MDQVATGSIKAQLAAKHTGTVNETGNIPIAIAKAPNTGRKVVVVVTLLVISVRKIIKVATAKINKIGGTELNINKLLPKLVNFGRKLTDESIELFQIKSSYQTMVLWKSL